MSELPNFPPPNASPHPPSSHRYQFQYPNTLICVPYHLNPTISRLASTLIPLTRSERQIPIDIPIQTRPESDAMEIEAALSGVQVELKREVAHIPSDGMLLYVAQATYEPGTSPLSLWIPVKAYTEERSDLAQAGTSSGAVTSEGPLDVFERYSYRSLWREFR